MGDTNQNQEAIKPNNAMTKQWTNKQLSTKSAKKNVMLKGEVNHLVYLYKDDF